MDGPALTASPGPRRLTFVTDPDDCNLACEMCPEHSPLAPERPEVPRRLPLALVARVLDELAGSHLAEVVPSTVGEPLLWRELPGLVGLCGARGLRLDVTTNGTFPRLGGAGWAGPLAPVASDVKVSWNGATAATAEAAMGGLRFDEALRQLREFVAGRDRIRERGQRCCTVTFQVTAMERNVAELPGVVRMAAAAGVERVRIDHLQVHFPELAGQDLRRSRASRARWNEAVRGMRRAAEVHLLPSGEAVRLQNAVELDEEGRQPEPGPCPFLGAEAWVLADGSFAPCPAPAAWEGRLGRFGSLVERGLLEIWRGPAYAALAAGYRENAVCAGCALRRPGGS